MHLFDLLIQEWHQLIAPEVGFWHILFWVFAASLLIQLLFFWIIYVRIAAHKTKSFSLLKQKEPVSVVIAARDEYLNLYENLPAILEQDYPDFEVIVVNNDSTDDSATLLKNFQLQYPHLKVITLERNLNFFKGKKFPLSLGIRAAKNDILIFTDADCKPASPDWINYMHDMFSPDTDIVLGVGMYQYRKGLLNRIIRFETFWIAIQYLSFAMAGMPYMGVGRNLAYRKSLFLKQKGFISHYKVSSGDDDLFVNQASRFSNIAIQAHPDSHTLSRPVTSLRRYFIQKRRHLSTGRHYRPLHKMVLGVSGLSQLLFYVAFIILMSTHTFIMLSIIAFVLRWISHCIIIKSSVKKFGLKIFCVFSPLMELSLLILQLALATANLFIKPVRWK